MAGLASVVIAMSPILTDGQRPVGGAWPAAGYTPLAGKSDPKSRLAKKFQDERKPNGAVQIRFEGGVVIWLHDGELPSPSETLKD
jgi:hypothetical protein